MNIGAWRTSKERWEFAVWAPLRKNAEIKVLSPAARTIELAKDAWGYWRGQAADLAPEARYVYVLDGELERPDPVSFYQPDGVHHSSGLVDHAAYRWNDQAWQGIPLASMIMYELHVGTFTEEGTFDGVIRKLDYLKELGVNAIEVMPVAQFPGNRNWGYDGVYPFAVQNSYGGPGGLKRLVDQCHKKGVAVILDVVYNHLGPEGNYLADFAPYFTQKYHTPWGWAVNFDDAHSPGVRNYFIQNALYWFEHFHIDALRLDAVHGIFDFSAKHILKELSENVDGYNRLTGKNHLLIAESDLNDVRIVEPRDHGGCGMDAQWLDDFHHALRTVITGDRQGYYVDFGQIRQLAKAYKDGFVYDWAYSSYRKKYFGSSAKHIPPQQFIAFTQNHDQVGNRMKGERLSLLVDDESLKLAAGAMIFSSCIPMLFMGEEFAADTPFLYFISHGDADLVNAVREGRKEEFAAFQWQGEPPDPYSEETFRQSALKWGSLADSRHRTMLAFYREIIRLRREIPAFHSPERAPGDILCNEADQVIVLSRDFNQSQVQCYLNFNTAVVTVSSVADKRISFKKVMDSADQQWGGPGGLAEKEIQSGAVIKLAPRSFVLYRK